MKIKQGKSLPIPECTLGGKRIIAGRTTDLLILDCYKDCVHVTGTTGMTVSRSIWKTGTKRSYKRRCGPR